MPQALVQSCGPPKPGASQAAQSRCIPSLLLAVGSMSHAGTTALHRTATAVRHATAGTHISEGVSLVVAARPSAGRSPAAAHSGIYRSPSGRQTRMGWGTLRFVKDKASCQSNTKVSRPSKCHVWLGRGRKSGSSKAAPNHFIEGTAKGLRPSSAPHVER
jgi:hypothetical protein